MAGCCGGGGCSSKKAGGAGAAAAAPPRRAESRTERLKRTFSETAEAVGAHIRALRLRLALYCVLPMCTALAITTAAGEPVLWTLQLVLELASISGCFAAFYDTLSQFTEAVYRWRQQQTLSLWQVFALRWDGWRTLRYAGIHFVYNGPYHMPKLLFLNWMYPGAPDASIALHKWMWATFVFSPGESFGVLSGVQIMRDQGSLENVCAKLRADFPQFQMTKWVGHAIPHYLSFLNAQSVLGIYTMNFAMKTIFELVLSFLAARPVRNKSDFKRDHYPKDQTAPDEEMPLGNSKKSDYSSI